MAAAIATERPFNERTDGLAALARACAACTWGDAGGAVDHDHAEQPPPFDTPFALAPSPMPLPPPTANLVLHLSPPLLLLSCGHAYKRRLRAILEGELGATCLAFPKRPPQAKKGSSASTTIGAAATGATAATARAGKRPSSESAVHQLLPFAVPPIEVKGALLNTEAGSDACLRDIATDWRLWSAARPAHNVFRCSAVCATWEAALAEAARLCRALPAEALPLRLACHPKGLVDRLIDGLPLDVPLDPKAFATVLCVVELPGNGGFGVGMLARGLHGATAFDRSADDAAVCRAYHKMREAAERWPSLLVTQGAACLDLGAAPGGWTQWLVAPRTATAAGTPGAAAAAAAAGSGGGAALCVAIDPGSLAPAVTALVDHPDDDARREVGGRRFHPPEVEATEAGSAAAHGGAAHHGAVGRTGRVVHLRETVEAAVASGRVSALCPPFTGAEGLREGGGGGGFGLIVCDMNSHPAAAAAAVGLLAPWLARSCALLLTLKTVEKGNAVKIEAEAAEALARHGWAVEGVEQLVSNGRWEKSLVARRVAARRGPRDMPPSSEEGTEPTAQKRAALARN